MEIPSADQLLKENQTRNKFQGKQWDDVRRMAIHNFKSGSSFLGRVPVDSIKIYELKCYDLGTAVEYKELFISMFAEKGYQIRVSYQQNFGLIGEERFTYYACLP